jgi:hypothetical protein
LDLVDKDASVIASHILKDKMHVVSAIAEAEALNVSTSKLQTVKTDTAFAAILLQRYDAHTLMRVTVDSLIERRGDPLCFSEWNRCDETTMKVRVRDTPLSLQGLQAALKNGCDDDAGQILLKVVDDASGPAKILNTEWRYGMLFLLGDGFLSITWQLCVPYQFMGRTTADCYWDCLHSSGLDTAVIAARFARRQRNITTDGDSALTKVWRCEAKASPTWNHLKKICVVHTGTNRKKEVVQRMQPVMVTSMVGVTKSFHSSNAVKTFRDELRDVLEERAVLNDTDEPSMIDVQNLTNVLDTHSNSRRAKWRRSVIEANISGGIRGRQLVHSEARCGAGCTLKRCKVNFRGSLANALCPRPPKNFPCRNWIGCEDAFDFCGLLDGLGGLFKETFTRWCMKHHGQHLRAMPAAGAGDAPALLDVDRPIGHVAGEERPVDPATQAGGGGDAAITKPDWELKKEEQARCRKVVLEYLVQSMYGVLVITRVCMEPFRAYVARLLYFAGEEYKRKARAAEASHHMDGNWSAGHIELPVLIAASGLSEQAFLDDIHSRLCDPKHYGAMPAREKTVKLRCDCFRMLSMSGCMLNEMREERMFWPNRLFLGIKDPCYITEAMNTSRCLLDEWSADFLDFYQPKANGLMAHDRP